MKPTTLNIITGFVLLFLCYHTAEYLMLFRNSALGFLAVSAIFFPLAFFIGRRQGDKNLQGWGILFEKRFPVYFLTGLLSGLALSSLMFITCLMLGVEAISFVPPLPGFLSQAALLIFGCSLSSLTEDVLTRGYFFRHAGKKLSQPALVLLSALVYALNHIHRLAWINRFTFFTFLC